MASNLHRLISNLRQQEMKTWPIRPSTAGQVSRVDEIMRWTGQEIQPSMPRDRSVATETYEFLERRTSDFISHQRGLQRKQEEAYQKYLDSVKEQEATRQRRQWESPEIFGIQTKPLWDIKPGDVRESFLNVTERPFWEPSKGVFGAVGEAIVSAFRQTIETVERATNLRQATTSGNAWQVMAQAIAQPSQPQSMREFIAGGAERAMATPQMLGDAAKIYNQMFNYEDTEWSKVLKPVEQSLNKWANLSEQNIATQITAQVASIIPYYVAMKANPKVALPMLYNLMYSQGIDNAVKEGADRTDPKLHIYSSASSALRLTLMSAANMLSNTSPAAIEGKLKAFRFVLTRTGDAPAIAGKTTAVGLASYYKSTLAFIKSVGDDYAREALRTGVDKTFGSVMTYMAQHIVTRANSEALSYMGASIIAHNTISKDQPLFTSSEEEGGLITPEGIRSAASAGALVGFVMGFASQYPQLKYANEWFKKNQNKTVPPSASGAKAAYNDLVVAVGKDMKDPANKQLVMRYVSAGMARGLTDAQQADVILGQPSDQAIELPSTTIPPKSEQAIPLTSTAGVIEMGGTESAAQQQPSEAAERSPFLPQTPASAALDAVSPAASIIAEAPSGNVISSIVAVGESVDTTVKSVPMSSLTPSMNADLRPFPGHDPQLQPRTTERQSSEILVDRIANNPDFNQFLGLETVREGMPVVSFDGKVISGNHRIAGLLRMKRDNPQKYAEYKDFMIANAEKFGLTPEQMQGNFVAVRVLPQGVNLRDIAEKTNIPTTQAMSPSEQARMDAGKITSRMLEMFDTSKSGDINSASNRDFVRNFISNVMAESEQNRYVTSSGAVNQDGIQRIINAMFEKAYNNPRLLERLSESTSDDIKNLTNVLVEMSPRIIKAEEAMRNGSLYPVPIGKMIADIAEQYAIYKASGTSLDVFVAQRDMLDTEDTMRAKAVLKTIKDRIRSKDKIQAVFDSYIDAIEAAGDPQQASIEQFFSAGEKVEITPDTVIKSGELILDARERGPEQIALPTEPKPTTSTIPGKKSDKVTSEKKIKSTRSRAEKMRKEPQMPRTPVKTDKEFDRVIEQQVLRGSGQGFKVPDESYNPELMNLAKKILAPARYDKLHSSITGAHIYEKGAKKSEIKLSSIEQTRTMAHEIGHALDYNIQGRNFEIHQDLKLSDRFPNISLSDKQLLAQAKKISNMIRPTDRFDKYRMMPTELIADAYSLYLMDPDAFEKAAPELYAAIKGKIDASPYSALIGDTVSKVTYKPKPAYILAMRPLKDINAVDRLAKSTKDKALSAYVRHSRKLKAAQADKRFVTKPWRKDYTKKEREDVGAIVEGIENISTGEMPKPTEKLNKLAKVYRYEIEKVRENINEMMSKLDVPLFINWLEDYLPHFYVRDNAMSNYVQGFRKNIQAASKRKFPTYKDAMDAGLTPLTQDVAELYEKYVDINLQAAFNVEFIKTLAEITDEQGYGIVQTDNPGDWKYVEHPAISKWLARKDPVSGKIIMKERGAYIHPEAYKGLRGFFEKPLRNIPIKRILQANAFSKNISLFLSGFHYANITESSFAVLGAKGLITRFDGKMTFAFKAGQSLMNEPEAVKDMLLAGLQVSPHADAMTGMVKDMLDNAVAKTRYIPVVGTAVKGYLRTQEALQSALWNKYVTPLKAYAYHDLVAKAMGKLPNDSGMDMIIAVKEEIASYLNDAFGGQEREKYALPPAAWQLAQALILAPDYTLSNINIAFKTPAQNLARFGKKLSGKAPEPEKFPGQRKMQNRLWLRYVSQMAIGLFLFMQGVNYAFNKKPTWKNEPGRKMHADVTSVYKALENIIPGFDAGDQRYYIGPGKQFREVFRYFSDPLEIIGAKMSPISRAVFNQVSKAQPGSGWDAPFKDMEFYESLPLRTMSLLEAFVPFSLRGSSFLLTFPLSRGMSWYKSQKAYEEVIRLQVDPSEFGKLMPIDQAEKIKKELDDAAIANGLDPDKQYGAARSKVRTDYYTRFFASINEGNMEKADEYARILVLLEVEARGLKQRGTNRKLTEEEMKRALEAYEKASKK